MLARPDTRVKLRRQTICGRSTWLWNEDKTGIEKIVIYLDPRRDGRVTLVLHELLHIKMAALLGIDDLLSDELEEVAVLGWEDKLYKWLHDPKRHTALESWNQAIERKMR